MVSCAACNRTKSKTDKEKNITYHKFPKNEEKRRVWIKFVGKFDWTPPKNAYLCSLHFQEDFLYLLGPTKVHLKEDAFPTIKIERLQYNKVHPAKILEAETCNNFDVPSTSTIDITNRPITPTNNLSLAIEEQDSPRKIHLKRKLKDLANRDKLKSKRIRALQKKIHYQKKKIHSLTSLMKILKQKNLIDADSSYCLLESFSKNADLIKRLFKKTMKQSLSKKYSQLERSFAVTLNFFSPKAYKYVKHNFNNSLPHPKTSTSVRC